LGCQISNGLKLELTADKSTIHYFDDVTFSTTLTNVSDTTFAVEVGYSTGGIYLQNGSSYLLTFKPSNDAKKTKYVYEGHGYCGTGAHPYHVILTPNEQVTYTVCGRLKGRSSIEYHEVYWRDLTTNEEEKKKRPEVVHHLLLDFGRGYVLPVNKPPKKTYHSKPSPAKKPKTTQEQRVPDVQKVFIQAKLHVTESTDYYSDPRRKFVINRKNEYIRKDALSMWIGESYSNFIPLTLDISQ